MRDQETRSLPLSLDCKHASSQRDCFSVSGVTHLVKMMGSTTEPICQPLSGSHLIWARLEPNQASQLRNSEIWIQLSHSSSLSILPQMVAQYGGYPAQNASLWAGDEFLQTFFHPSSCYPFATKDRKLEDE